MLDVSQTLLSMLPWMALAAFALLPFALMFGVGPSETELRRQEAIRRGEALLAESLRGTSTLEAAAALTPGQAFLLGLAPKWLLASAWRDLAERLGRADMAREALLAEHDPPQASGTGKATGVPAGPPTPTASSA